ncbi:MAG TPA: FtsX-like permease family protein [Ktedonobacterales bacterium]|nr:FtsX-like permease family protein [Ktedonobacterales bacterium]
MSAAIYWRYPTRAVLRAGQHTGLATLCVAIVALAFVALQLVGNMVDTSLTGDIRGLNGADVQLISPRIPAADLAWFDGLRAAGTITAYTAVAADQAAAVGRHPVARIDRITMVDPNTFPLAGAPEFEAPAHAALRDALSGASVVLTHDLAGQLGVHSGETIGFTLADGRPARLAVGGIIANAGQFQESQAVISLATYLDLRLATAPSLAYSKIYLDVPGHSAAAAAALQSQLQGRYPQGDIVTASELLRINQQQVRAIRTFLQVTVLIALVIGGLGIVNTMRVLLRRRTVEIALLKTEGYTRRHLFALFGMEALLIGVVGGVVGAVAGVVASLVVKDVVAAAFNILLVTAIDPLTVAAGVALGGATALIFGVLPIAQASQVRPLAVLREQPEGMRLASRAVALLLVALLLALFYALALAILGDAVVALLLVAGVAVALAVLGAVFALVTGGVGLVPAALLLPRRWQTPVRLALRNLGRQRWRTATTQASLFAGIFATGVILLLGQGLQSHYGQPSQAIDASVGVNSLSQVGAVESHLRQASGVTRVERYATTLLRITEINGAPLSASTNPFAGMGKIEGYDLASGQVPRAPDVTVSGGRNLTDADAGTLNALFDPINGDPSLNIRVGDQVTVQYTTKFSGTPAGNPLVTLVIVGFATNNTLFAGRAGDFITDDSAVTAIAGTQAAADLLAHIDPQQADAVLTAMLAAFPGQVYVHNLGSVVADEEAYFKNVFLALQVVVLPALVAAFIIVANTVALAMLERRRELGTLKAVGYTSRGVLAGMLIEQGVAGLLAALLAMLAALGGVGLLAKSQFQLTIAVNPPQVAAIIVAATALCVLVAAAVAWRPARVRPLEVLRYE